MRIWYIAFMCLSLLTKGVLAEEGERSPTTVLPNEDRVTILRVEKMEEWAIGLRTITPLCEKLNEQKDQEACRGLLAYVWACATLAAPVPLAQDANRAHLQQLGETPEGKGKFFIVPLLVRDGASGSPWSQILADRHLATLTFGDARATEDTAPVPIVVFKAEENISPFFRGLLLAGEAHRALTITLEYDQDARTNNFERGVLMEARTYLFLFPLLAARGGDRYEQLLQKEAARISRKEVQGNGRENKITPLPLLPETDVALRNIFGDASHLETALREEIVRHHVVERALTTRFPRQSSDYYARVYLYFYAIAQNGGSIALVRKE